MYNQSSSSITFGHSSKSLKALFSFLTENMSLDEVQNLYHLTKSDMNSIIRSDSVAFDKALDIARISGFTLDKMMKEGVDHQAVLDKFQGNSFIPQKYFKIAYTRKRISFMIFKAIEGIYGKTFLTALMRYMQIDERFLKTNENDFVSTNFNADIYKTLIKYFKFSQQDIMNLGLSINLHDENNPFVKAFDGLSVVHSYSKFVEEIYAKLENSHQYKILKLDRKKIILQKKLSPKLIEENSGKLYGSYATCLYSAGYLGSLYSVKTRKTPKVKINKNLYINGDYSEYEVSF